MYAKFQIDDIEVLVALEEDGFYSTCPVCGNEVNVDYDVIVNIVQEGVIEDTEVYCDSCSDKYHDGLKPKIYRIK